MQDAWQMQNAGLAEVDPWTSRWWNLKTEKDSACRPPHNPFRSLPRPTPARSCPWLPWPVSETATYPNPRADATTGPPASRAPPPPPSPPEHETYQQSALYVICLDVTPTLSFPIRAIRVIRS